MQYEELLIQISRRGACYRWIVTTLLAIVSMKLAYNMFVMNLATAGVPYHCAIALVDNKTHSMADVLANRTIVGNFSALDYTCTVPRFRTDADGLLNVVNTTASNQSEACTSWSFMPDPPDRWTIFIEYQLVCDRRYLSDRLQTMLQIGICVSTLLGPLGDIIGRKPFFLLFAYIDFACYVGLIFAKDITLQMVLLFFMGFGTQSMLIGLILISELVSEEYRGLHGNLIWIVYVIGYSSSAAISYYILNWRMQMVAVAVIVGVFYVTYIPVIPESPQWLLYRGKTKRAKKVLKEICKFSNCKELLENFDVDHNELVDTSQRQEETNCIFQFLPRENLCRLEYFLTLGVVTFCLCTLSLVYYALSFQRDFISQDPYLNVLISGLLELPAYILAWQLTTRIGRKYTSLGAIGFCGVGLIVLPYIPNIPDARFQVSSAMAIAVKFSVTVAFSVFAVYGNEVLPTSVRSCSFFFACLLMGGGMILAPELGGALSAVYEHLPYLIYGTVSVLACLSILVLPETKNRTMPNTVREMEPIGCPSCAPPGDVEVDGARWRATGGGGKSEKGNGLAAEELKPLQT